jgi:ketosteroid isomerase-like protein
MSDLQVSTLVEKVQDLNRMIDEGKILEAFEKYYADDVVMREVGQEPRRGKDANRAYEEAWVAGLSKIAIDLIGVAVNEETGRAYVEARYDFEHTQWGHLSYNQVAAQTWKDGKIVEETFYHADWDA